jgi:hypothetical protein
MWNMLDKDALRKITLDAQGRQKTKHAKQQAEKKADDEQKHLAAEQRAQEIIRSIPEIARTEAEKGNWAAAIMTLAQTGDYDGSKCSYDFHLDSLLVGPEALIGAAKMVYQHCQKAGLQPSVERVFTGSTSHYWVIEICWLEEGREGSEYHREPWYRRWFRRKKRRDSKANQDSAIRLW